MGLWTYKKNYVLVIIHKIDVVSTWLTTIAVLKTTSMRSLHVFCSLRIASRLVTKKSGCALIGEAAQEVRSVVLFHGSLSTVPSTHHGCVTGLSLQTCDHVPLNHSLVTSLHYSHDETSQHCEENECSESQYPQKYDKQPLILHMSHQLDLRACEQGNKCIRI